MLKPIPLKIRNELNQDVFMKTCCLSSGICRGRIEWHHNFIYAGKRVNEKGSILPVCQEHHKRESAFKKELNKIMFQRMSDKDRSKYPKRNWHE